MSVGRFEGPLLVAMPRGGLTSIRSARQAVDYLSIWPIESETAQVAARICNSAIQGWLHPKVARRAFEKAAREAKRLTE